jgi:7,8-dihydropterin-6-yl-methyl-4-(beta-D-ribofuranosyl)aminobenzene 5'-phosphate synthase
MALTISVLLENRRSDNEKKSLRVKPGLSLLIQDSNTKILFDTGPDDSFLYNATLMGLDLSKLTATVLSHGHYDHCGGVPWLPDNCRIICHPNINNERHSAITFKGYTKKIKKLSLDIDYLHYRMVYSCTPLHISDRFIWSGEIEVPRPQAYGVIGGEKKALDYIIDEGVLIYKSDRGLVIIIGCGHRGIINIIRYCQKITGINHIHALFGGFHLRCASPRVLWEIRKFLKQQKPDIIMGCHCTGAWGRLWLPEVVTPATGDAFVFE